jgi:FKBP-type peptidyl-prolyl cis-trans isomerase
MEEFTQMDDDKGLYKKILKEGYANRPKVGDVVKIYYTGILENGTVFEENNSGDGLTFKIGHVAVTEQGTYKIINGLETGIKSMRKGEKSILVMRSDYAYGEEGRLTIPPYASLIYCVDLIDIK